MLYVYIYIYHAVYFWLIAYVMSVMNVILPFGILPTPGHLEMKLMQLHKDTTYILATCTWHM